MYEIIYLPIAKKDLAEIATYITDNLKAPMAAMDLLETLDKSISRLGEFPFSCKVYQSETLESEYRLLPVKNYAVFYVVEERIVVVHRVIYAKRNITKIIK